MTEDVLCCQPYTYSILTSEDDHNPKISIKINPLFDFQSKINEQQTIIQKLQEDRTQNMKIIEERNLVMKKMFQKIKYDEAVINELKVKVLEFEEKEKLGFSTQQTLKKQANEQKQINEVLSIKNEKLKNQNSEQRLNLEQLRKSFEHELKVSESNLLQAEVADLRAKIAELNQIIQNQKLSKLSLESQIQTLRKETESLMLSPSKQQSQNISKRKQFQLKRLKSENEKLEEDLNLLQNEESDIVYISVETQTENENQFTKTDSAIEQEQNQSEDKKDNHQIENSQGINVQGTQEPKMRQEESIEEINQFLQSQVLNQADEKSVEKQSQQGNAQESAGLLNPIEAEKAKFENLQKQFEQQKKSLQDLQQQNELLRLNIEQLKEAELFTTEKLQIQSKKVSELLKQNSKLEKKNSKLDSSKNSKGSKTSEKSDNANNVQKSNQAEILKFKKEIEQKNQKIKNLEQEKDRLKVLTSDLLKETEEIMKNINQNKSVEKHSQQNIEMISAPQNELENKINEIQALKNDSNQIKQFFLELCQHFQASSENQNMKVENLLAKLRKVVGINLETERESEIRKLDEQNDENLLASEQQEGGFSKTAEKCLKITNLNELPLIFCEGSKQEETKLQQLQLEPIFIVQENIRIDAQKYNQHSQNVQPIAQNLMSNFPLMLAPLNLQRQPFTVVPLLSTTVPYSNQSIELQKQFLINNFRNIDKIDIEKLLNLSLERQGQLLSELQRQESMSQKNIRWLVENVGSCILQEFIRQKCVKHEQGSC